MNAADIIGYTADADHYCGDCAAERYGPDYRCSTCGRTFGDFPGDSHHWTEGGGFCGPVEPTGREDSEGNPVQPVFGGDEWWEPSSERCEVLACADCRAELDVAHADGCPNYVISDRYDADCIGARITA